MNGFLLIDKDKGMTSFDVVKAVRRISGERRVGHSGTLDPLATGLLVLALGEGTKLLEFFIGCDKEYLVDARFGMVSDTYDTEGEVVEKDFDSKIDEEEVSKVVREKFIGEIEQIPPKYSALKVKGKRACDIVRSGGDVELEPRRIEVFRFDIEEFDWPGVKFRIKCSSGTYIRSLIYDLGEELGCGALVEGLRRIVVGDFSLEKAVKLEELSKNIDHKLISLTNIAQMFNIWEISSEEYEGLKDGKTLLSKNIDHGAIVMALYRGKLVGVLVGARGGGVKYKKMIYE